MKRTTLTYYITFVTHGTTLKGRDVVPSDAPPIETPYALDGARRGVVCEAIREVCDYREWRLWAVHVRTNQIHAVVEASVRPEKVIKDFKAYSGRRLKKRLRERLSVKRWAPEGAGFVLLEAEELRAEIAFTLRGQGEPMEVFDGTKAAGL